MFGSCRPFDRANRNLIGVANRSNVVCRQGDHSLRASGCPHELDLDAIRLVDFDDGAKIAATQSMVGHVSVQYNGIEQVVLHSLVPGNAVTKRGTSSPERTIQAVTMAADLPDGPFRVPRTSYFCP